MCILDIWLYLVYCVLICKISQNYMIVVKTHFFISSDFNQRLSKEIASLTDRVSIQSAHPLMVLSAAHVAHGNTR